PAATLTGNPLMTLRLARFPAQFRMQFELVAGSRLLLIHAQSYRRITARSAAGLLLRCHQTRLRHSMTPENGRREGANDTPARFRSCVGCDEGVALPARAQL